MDNKLLVFNYNLNFKLKEILKDFTSKFSSDTLTSVQSCRAAIHNCHCTLCTLEFSYDLASLRYTSHLLKLQIHPGLTFSRRLVIFTPRSVCCVARGISLTLSHSRNRHRLLPTIIIILYNFYRVSTTDLRWRVEVRWWYKRSFLYQSPINSIRAYK